MGVVVKPIIEGCRAVIVNSQEGNNGIIVRVLNRAPDDHSFSTPQATNRWHVDKAIRSSHQGDLNHVGECMLIRIDDDEQSKDKYTRQPTTTWDKCVWQPNKETV